MTILDRIVDHKRGEIERMPEHADAPRCTRNFDRIFSPRPGLIAEIKTASPSEGDIVDRKAFDPLSIACAYEQGGATAMSILTDNAFFGGSFDVLRAVRQATDLPLLCKDFILSERQVRHARVCGADMVLLIVKILEPVLLRDLKDAIDGLGMKALIEVQTEAERDAALLVGPDMILINNRNLENFSVDLNTADRIAAAIPDPVKVVAASGINGPDDLARFSSRMDAFLIGTALMRSPDKVSFLRKCHEHKN